MHYKAELAFLQKLLNNFMLKVNILTPESDTFPAFDLGLRSLLHDTADYKRLLLDSSEKISSNKIYHIVDEYLCNYIFFLLPECSERKYLLIGPYTTAALTKREILNCAQKHSLPPKLYTQYEKYCLELPLLVNEDILTSIINTFGELIWGSSDNFSVEYINRLLSENVIPVAERPDYQEPEEALLSMKVLEDRYVTENNFMKAVAHGQVHKAMLPALSEKQMEKRLTDPIRDLKNYTIILNTLLRKAAETGLVHPLHIDSLSSQFARKIEQITSENSGMALQKEMVHKYCLLVKNHSMKGYSLLIRQILTRIDSDLTADLSLKTQAKLLNVNASYLSTLFKKETGSTLTDYVNRKRVEHALFLLNSTNMLIQTIAQYCGIPDVNYFTKTFKKYIGQTPKEYRDEIVPYL